MSTPFTCPRCGCSTLNLYLCDTCYQEEKHLPDTINDEAPPVAEDDFTESGDSVPF